MILKSVLEFLEENYTKITTDKFYEEYNKYDLTSNLVPTSMNNASKNVAYLGRRNKDSDIVTLLSISYPLRYLDKDYFSPIITKSYALGENQSNFLYLQDIVPIQDLEPWYEEM